MSKYGIIVNADDCVGCHACFVACKEENQVAPGVKWNHLERLEHPAEEVIEYFRVSCMHCEDPACMKVCPVKAVYFGPHGEVLLRRPQTARRKKRQPDSLDNAYPRKSRTLHSVHASYFPRTLACLRRSLLD